MKDFEIPTIKYMYSEQGFAVLAVGALWELFLTVFFNHHPIHFLLLSPFDPHILSVGGVSNFMSNKAAKFT